MKRKPPPSHLDIVMTNLDMLRSMSKFETDTVEELAHTCWACGIGFEKDRKPERAHVLAHSRGGSNEPDNYFLLCSGCHADQPDVLERDLQIEWLENHEEWADHKLWLRRYPRSMDAVKKAVQEGHGAQVVEIVINALTVEAAARNVTTRRSNIDVYIAAKVKQYLDGLKEV